MNTPLRIGYVGNFKPSHSTETHLARTLEQLGHTVNRLQEDELTPDALTRSLTRMDLDVFWFTRTWGHTVKTSHLDLLRHRGIASVSHHLDLYLGLDRGGANDPKSASQIGRDPFWLTDFVFSPDGDPDCAEQFAKMGINHHYLPPGVVADECYLAAGIEPTRDVVFVGSGPDYHNEWPYRGRLLRWLSDTYGSRFTQHGGRGKPVRGHELNMLYAGTRVTVGDSLVLNFTHRGYSSDRRYEAPGRGAFQIHPWIDGINDGFKDGVNTVFYQFNDLSSLKDRIDHYLTHDAERERIRLAGHEHVKANHTYTNRMTTALTILRAEGAIA